MAPPNPRDGVPLTLHVLPPALGLPSADADCLTAILLLQRALPAGRWALVADGWRDLAAGHDLPTLRIASSSSPSSGADGDIVHHGLDAVLAALRAVPGARDPDAPLSPRQHADALAYAPSPPHFSPNPNSR